jgi:hypothetical protein
LQKATFNVPCAPLQAFWVHRFPKFQRWHPCN